MLALESNQEGERRHEEHEVNTGKVVANAGSHRIMYALSNGPAHSKDLKLVAGAINSVNRFDGEYMARLESNGFVKRRNGLWELTKRGHEKLEELGPARGMRAYRRTQPVSLYDIPNYDPKLYNKTVPRPGSEEFLKCPSRVGDTLYYRDGRIEHIGE